MGRLLVIDGTDGVGKQTQTALLVDNLTARGLKVGTIDFPAYDRTLSGREVRAYLRGEFGDITGVHPKLVSYLFAADRFEEKDHLLELLSENDIVIADRYATSSIVYQSTQVPNEERAAFREWCAALNYEVFGIPKEDAGILLSLPVENSVALMRARSTGEKDIFEENTAFLTDVFNEYHALVERSDHWSVVRCEEGEGIRTREAIAEEVLRIVEQTVVAKVMA